VRELRGGRVPLGGAPAVFFLIGAIRD